MTPRLTEVDARDRPALEDLDSTLEQYRTELRGHCSRMLGSSFEAEDAVQETMVRAWTSHDGFEGRSSLRSWLYRIATNVSLDMLQGRKRQAVPIGSGPAPGDLPRAVLANEVPWVDPMPDGLAVQPTDDPAELASTRETIRVAFVAALDHLPPKQRAVLILRDVLRWRASEVAELLDTTVVSVNSALQRARATLAASTVSDDATATPADAAEQALLERYVTAFEQYDVEALVALLRNEATGRGSVSFGNRDGLGSDTSQREDLAMTKQLDNQTLVDFTRRWFALWTEADPQARSRQVADLWATGSAQVLVDPPQAMRDAVTELAFPVPRLEVRGHDEIDRRVTQAYAMFIEPGEYTFTATEGDAVLLAPGLVGLAWDMVTIADGTVVGSGYDVIVLDDEGRIVLDHQHILS
jgi:RNA polymerase sigma-70 factor (ECF subfamily)